MSVGTGRPRPSAAVPARLILRLSSLAVALLRLVVVPCLNAHKRPVRDPLYFLNSLLGRTRCCSAFLRRRASVRRTAIVTRRRGESREQHQAEHHARAVRNPITHGGEPPRNEALMPFIQRTVPHTHEQQQESRNAGSGPPFSPRERQAQYQKQTPVSQLVGTGRQTTSHPL